MIFLLTITLTCGGAFCGQITQRVESCANQAMIAQVILAQTDLTQGATPKWRCDVERNAAQE